MTDYFTQWVVPLKLENKEEIKWVKRVNSDLHRLCELAEDLSSDEDHKEYHELKKVLGDIATPFGEDNRDYVSFGFDVELASDKKSGTAYYISDENGDPEQVAAVLQAFLKQFHPDRRMSFEWADTCSKMRSEGFGGGAVFITATDIQYMSTSEWLRDREQAFDAALEAQGK